jgi:hypothetical protein
MISRKINPIMYLRRVSYIFWVIKHTGRHSCHYTHQHCENSPSYFTWHQACWTSGKALNLYLGGAQFESWLGYWLSWLSFSSLSRVLPGKCQHGLSQLDQEHFLPNPLQFITSSSIHNRVYILTALLNNPTHFTWPSMAQYNEKNLYSPQKLFKSYLAMKISVQPIYFKLESICFP